MKDSVVKQKLEKFYPSECVDFLISFFDGKADFLIEENQILITPINLSNEKEQ